MKLTYLLLLLAILNIVAFSSKTCIRKATSKPVTSKPITLKRCYIGGCSGQVCSDRNDIVTTCIWKPEYACYEDATCERQANGQCGWTQTEELQQCIEDANGPCYVSGCSNQICSDQENVASTCEWREEYACYQDAICERQRNGFCGWTQTTELNECLGNASS